MTHSEHLFVFVGPAGRRAANAFAMMDKVHVKRLGRDPARIVILADDPALTNTNLVDLTKPATSGIQVLVEQSPVAIVAESPDDVHIILLEDIQTDLSMPAERRFLDASKVVEQAPVVEEPEDEEDSEAQEDDSVDDGEEMSLTPEIHFKITRVPLMPLDGTAHTKPRKDILVHTVLYGAPGNHNWTQSQYIDQSLLQRISRLVESETSLSFELSDYAEAFDIISFLSWSSEMAGEKELVDRYNKLVCNHEITQLALRIHSTKIEGALSVSVLVNQEAMQNAAVFVPLLYKDDLGAEHRVEDVRHSENYRVVFMPPFPNRETLIDAVSEDMAMRSSIVCYHELNRKLLEEDIFTAGEDIIFYSSKTLFERIEELADANIQELLEGKERYYAQYLNRQLLRCLSLHEGACQ